MLTFWILRAEADVVENVRDVGRLGDDLAGIWNGSIDVLRLSGSGTKNSGFESGPPLDCLRPFLELEFVEGETVVVAADALDLRLEVLSRNLGTFDNHLEELQLLLIAFDLVLDDQLLLLDLLNLLLLLRGEIIKPKRAVYAG